MGATGCALWGRRGGVPPAGSSQEHLQAEALDPRSYQTGARGSHARCLLSLGDAYATPKRSRRLPAQLLLPRTKNNASGL